VNPDASRLHEAVPTVRRTLERMSPPVTTPDGPPVLDLRALTQALPNGFCRDLGLYWAGLPKRPVLPNRSDFDPADIPRILPHVVFHDLRSPGRSILRVVGTRVVERFGLDPTGRDYTDFVAADRRARAYEELWKVARHPCGMHVTMRAVFEGGRSTTAGALGLPLQADADPEGRFLVFVDELLPDEGARPEWWDTRAHPLLRFEVLARSYVNIGAGIPGSARP
jgi:hypothetical protein